MGDQQPETLTVRLSRPNSGVSWGFRLQGGKDFKTPLSVQAVQPQSAAERCGLRAGDGIVTINNTATDELTHEQAKMEIIRSLNDIDFFVVRGAVQIWKPKVTKLSELRPAELQPIHTATGDDMYAMQKTSLAKEKQDEPLNIGTAYNRSAKPFGGGRVPQQPQQQAPQSPKRATPNVVHAQFNSPIGLYSAGNIAHSYSQQTAGIEQQMQNLDVSEDPVGTRMTGTYHRVDSLEKSPAYGTQFSDPTSPTGSQGEGHDAHQSAEGLQNDVAESPECLPPENGVTPSEHAPTLTNDNNNSAPQFGGSQSQQPSGFKSVSAPVAKPPGTSSAPKQESMHCNGCGNMVTGVFVRVKGLPYHEKCFKCANCGLFLKQKGYFMIEGQLYCEVHARRAAEAPGDNMRYAGAVYR